MSTINEMLTAAIAARKDSLTALRSRIAELLEPIPVGVVLSDCVPFDGGGELEREVCKIVRICTGASQWGNRTWDVTIKGKGAVAGGELVCEIELDSSYWDGNNMHNRSTEPTCLYAHGDAGEALTFVPGAALRALAARLPVAIERYVEKCGAEVEANAATLGVLEGK